MKKTEELVMIAPIKNSSLNAAVNAVYAARPQGNYEGGRVYVFFDREKGTFGTRTCERKSWLDLDLPGEDARRVRTMDERVTLLASDFATSTPEAWTKKKQIRNDLSYVYYVGDEDERMENDGDEDEDN